MIHFLDGHLYRTRACAAWNEMQSAPDFRADYRDYDAAYCLDAIDESPAGATWRIEPDRGQPFAAPRHAWGRV